MDFVVIKKKKGASYSSNNKLLVKTALPKVYSRRVREVNWAHCSLHYITKWCVFTPHVICRMYFIVASLILATSFKARSVGYASDKNSAQQVVF